MADRKSHSYKCKDVFYNESMARASKEFGSLAQLLECVVIAYSSGLNIVAQKNTETGSNRKKYITLDEVVATYRLEPKQ